MGAQNTLAVQVRGEGKGGKGVAGIKKIGGRMTAPGSNIIVLLF